MKKPFLTYLKDFLAFQRVVVVDRELSNLATADQLLTQLITEKKIPGLAISVRKEGKSYFQKGYGFADIKNKVLVHPQTSIFRIASVSKPIAATALAHLVADGLIDLDASFYTYVPYYPKKKWDFTIRQLANHTAGIRSYLGKEYGLNEPYSIKESIAIFKDDDLLFEPGTRYQYSSYDWVLISLAIQEITGTPFETYLQKKVLHPLGLKNTFAPNISGDDVTIAKDTKLHVTKFYTKNRLGFHEAIPVNNYFKLAGGGYLATAEDVAFFGQAFLDKKVLNDAVLNQFLRSETLNGKLLYYGLGWQVSTDKSGRDFYGHIGNGVGGYSNFFVYPEQKIVIAILINCTNPEIQNELDQVIDYLFL
ncbi:serine hydrolase [Cellulophaga sp. Hel_I_12]|uniref:serine hydrolase domain-containing protein n=1 Tax=Cellulophaga sp. Hel_I_12 TaxID=1249972 RepID=UPI0006454DDC|nr:serine hydrolase domain-containing protein [Cellulophaga sp. Hel_I_12]